MASPTLDSGISESEPTWQIQTQHLPLWLRRGGAWLAEISLVVVSGVVPFSLGVLCNQDVTEPVPMNSVLVITSETVARTLALPVRESNQKVAPLTNLLWSLGLVAPLAVGGWQLWLLAKTGQTLPKRWLGLRVVTDSGLPPGWKGMIVRECLGKWGIPLGLAYLMWHISGAYPSLMILTGLSGLMMASDGMIMRFDAKRRMGHDRIADTLVVDALSGKPYSNPFFSPSLDEDAEIAAIVVTPETPQELPQNLWLWMRQHPGLTILIVTFASMAAVLGTFVGTQIYIQDQANSRQFKEQDDKVFLALVSQLSPNADNPTVEQQRAILALGSVKDYRAAPLLVDMLGQETNPKLLGVIEQALVSRGTQALPDLRRLSLAIANELDSLRNSNNTKAKQVIEARQLTTQRAISKILKVNSGFLQNVDLSSIDLSQNTVGSTGFTLVLDRTNLSGIRFRSARLIRASLQNTSFAAPGPDGRLGTFDDVVADLSGADLEGANLTRANFSYAMLNRTNLFQATLNQANFSSAQLRGINFSSAKLVGANLERAFLAEAKFTGTDLTGANLANANLEASRFTKANAEGAKFTSARLVQSDWQGASLSGTDFTRSNLNQTNFTGARLSGTNFQSTQLKNANFTKAVFKAVNFQGANLEGADFQDAQFSKEAPSQEFLQNRPETAKMAGLEGVDFTGAKNLNDTQITYICSQGAIHSQCP